MKSDNPRVLELKIENNGYEFLSSIDSAREAAQNEITALNETIQSIQELKPQCDKLDYILAAGSGAVCGIIDVFLVGKPGESPLGRMTDQWFSGRVMDFAKFCGWKGGNATSAIRFLEKTFKVPYDQNGLGDIAKGLMNLTPANHHFKSLAHNPSLLGLFFSILDQFQNTSHFVSGGALITVDNADHTFALRGNSIPAKFFCAFANWFGHLMSDLAGSSVSSKRGMGIPSPLWTWVNDIAALKAKLNIPTSELNRYLNDLSVEIYKKGFDTRFQSAQVIPVILNEMLVRLLYAIRRMLRYYSNTRPGSRSFSVMWKQCSPFSNPTVNRMLTVAHGTFCLIDAGDATIRGFAAGGGQFNPCEFLLRINIVGLGRFTISLYGEVRNGILIYQREQQIAFAKREKVIVQNYLAGLQELSEIYNDKELLTFINDFEQSNMYIQGFHKTALLAEKRNVSSEKILRNKKDIDDYFLGGKRK